MYSPNQINHCNISLKFLKNFSTAGDCFELGRQSYNIGDYYHTVLWMQEAMDRLQEEQNHTAVSKPDILEYLAFSTYMQGYYNISIYNTNFICLTFHLFLFNLTVLT